MMIEISVDEVKGNIEKYMCRVEEGIVLVITRDGKTIAWIMPEKSSLGRKEIGESTSKKIRPKAPFSVEPDSRESGSWIGFRSGESGKKGGVLR